ncbi:UDPglucose 6-dehydrogenase [Kitasatospora sp. MAP12-15]|uniref:UDP-glucose dehydrogenase family protein n=1 Tax=unclassified Kitasatospora TaxID=2633591 RepID=UPI002477024D|nr:UDP-glucose/GDP-mannose dehydrogenase family protein [Kitasatospora sp. MAP12-44]MDH6108530.1 UDPglucose 6-dehydrogenase [Kitasatospora sp. MAP12-44]
MRVSVIGCGHLGAPHAAAMAELGHEVVGVELDPAKAAQLATGKAWFYEEGLDGLLARHVAGGRLRFTEDIREAAEFADVHFLAVGTPLAQGGQGYDMSQLIAACQALAPHLTRPSLIIGKSTVTVGTVAKITEVFQRLAPAGTAEVSWNPEFLREGHAIEDTLTPDRIVIGLTSERAERTVREVYAPILAGGVELIVTDPQTAEMIKSAANSFLAMKISYINAMSDVCALTGADVNTLAYALGVDARIGHGGMRPGIGYGGGCLPKDVRAFTHRIGELGARNAHQLLEAVDAVNRARPVQAADLVARACDGTLAGRRIAVLGASFKAGTDDLRDSPALNLAELLHRRGALPVVYDPQAGEALARSHPEFVHATSALDAIRGAQAVVIGTEWPQFTKDPELPAAAALLAARRVVIDVRNAVDTEVWQRAGWQVWQLGRPTRHPVE